jgi:hypothetical protein
MIQQQLSLAQSEIAELRVSLAQARSQLEAASSPQFSSSSSPDTIDAREGVRGPTPTHTPIKSRHQGGQSHNETSGRDMRQLERLVSSLEEQSEKTRRELDLKKQAGSISTAVPWEDTTASVPWESTASPEPAEDARENTSWDQNMDPALQAQLASLPPPQNGVQIYLGFNQTFIMTLTVIFAVLLSLSHQSGWI